MKAIGYDSEEMPRRMAALDERALKEFATVFGPRFRAFFLRRGLPEPEAEDLAVSCITDVALKIEKYDPDRGGNFAAWVFTLARHALAEWWRRHRASSPLPLDLAVHGRGDDLVASSAVIEAVRDAVSRLSEDDQLLLRLRDLEENQSYDEIAHNLGIRAGAARVRHLRSLRKLRDLLESDPRIQNVLRRERRREEAP